ncbi:MAG TPA: Sir2 family NAD-dependent protein deacetylase [Bacteroidia bacterium]|nr:Sir2 family NAD-dependent protein deacetylase [Bacteroidia bacterium]
MSKKKLLVFTGAGISAESGIRTFRDAGGLWEQYKIEEVATPQAWETNRDLVLEFYNQRRRQVLEAKPNEAHHFIAELQDKFDVKVVTQNVDDLHERAGSKFVLHLHGEIMKARSSVDPNLIYPLESRELKAGDTCEKGSQLRPHIVWFGEMVTEMEHANYLASQTDLFVVIGTSLNVYPAAGIINFVLPSVPKWVVDPVEFDLEGVSGLRQINKTAVNSVPELRKALEKYH